MASTIADRIRLRCSDLGISPTSLEDGRLIGRGYISRLLKPGRTTFRIGPDKIAVLAAKLSVSSDWLSTGRGDMHDPRAVPMGPPPGVRPTLSQLPGYHDAEIAVARKRPKVPLEVLHQARDLAFADGGPELVTEEFLDDLIQFLSRQSRVLKHPRK